MVDMCKCANEQCNRKDSCWRYVAPANPYRQSYFADVNGNGEECNYWIRVPRGYTRRSNGLWTGQDRSDVQGSDATEATRND